jgi:hypothetical protein
MINVGGESKKRQLARPSAWIVGAIFGGLLFSILGASG